MTNIDHARPWAKASVVLSVLLLCQGEVVVGRVAVDGGVDGHGWLRWGWRALEEVPYAAGEVAFEAAQCFASCFAFGLFAGEVGGGVGVVESFGDREAV
jgi:hypothetical protein